MNICPLSIILIIILCFSTSFSDVTGTNTPSKPEISINCGSPAVSTASNGREWIGDNHKKMASLLQIKGTSTSSSSTHRFISGDPVIYKTARISHSKFFYTFRLNPGQKILRLHFYPTPYKGFASFKDSFTVEAAQFILLKNFSASLTAQELGKNTFTKEFYISTEENQPLNLIFTPTTSPEKERTYAFVNGIEIISVIAHLSYFQDENLRAQVIGQKSMVYVDNNTALELIHKLNVKHDSGLKSDEFDTVQMRSTVPKPKPNHVNVFTWKRSVHVGFRYLIRIHFSEIGLKIAETGHLMFKVIINELVVESSNDIVRESYENAKIRHRDYLMVMKGRKEDGQRDLSISLHLDNEFADGDGILKGFEILKVCNPDNSLASPNPLPLARNDQSWMSLHFFSVMGPKDIIATIATMIIFVISIVSYKLREISEMENRVEENKPSARAERHCRLFSLVDIQSATRNFSDAVIIGRGGFGKVYKGNIDNGNEIVAIKRLNAFSCQGHCEFWTEIETLSELRHINLVSLIGYCNEREEMILVYEYMTNGTLSDQLYKLERKNESSIFLTWKQRLNICIGAGRGLDYLHTGHRVIHRDVKPSNILLDENFIAKLADFGLAKPEDRSKLQSHVSTNVKGTFGYFDPYYMSTRRLTSKSDVYAFGVVLFEVLCGRPAVDRTARENERSLTMWARNKINEGKVNEILDSNLIGEILPDSLTVFVEVAESCLHDEPKKRPTMSQVVVKLEFSLELQERRNVYVPNQETRISDDSSPANYDTELLVDAEQVPFIDSANRTNGKVANNESPTGSRDGQKLKKNKLVRPRRWYEIWNRSKPSKEEELVSKMLSEIREAGIDVHKFDFANIAEATNQFSLLNKIGEGRFVTVYKGVLPTGQMLAVKRLRQVSFPWLNEFKNEIFLLNNLHHRNIIWLLGYCSMGEDVMLVYEFMENQSLYTHMHDATKCRLLDWSLRFKIIMQIARAIMYLHQEMRIIHGDITASNILLDNEMNPKISSFALARTLEDDKSVIKDTISFENASNTWWRIFGGGYMAPEYAILGEKSVMTDIYSFGIVVLETLCGNKRGQYHFDVAALAWKLWNEGKPLDLIDESLDGSFTEDEVLRCIQVGLLCTNVQPSHRPTISYVFEVLHGEKYSALDLHEKLKAGSTRKVEQANLDEIKNGKNNGDSTATFEYDIDLQR